MEDRLGNLLVGNVAEYINYGFRTLYNARSRLWEYSIHWTAVWTVKVFFDIYQQSLCFGVHLTAEPHPPCGDSFIREGDSSQTPHKLPRSTIFYIKTMRQLRNRHLHAG